MMFIDLYDLFARDYNHVAQMADPRCALDPYQMLQSVVVLRRMLLDSGNTVHKVNSESGLRLKMKFLIQTMPDLSAIGLVPDLMVLPDGLAPDPDMPMPVGMRSQMHTVNWDGFLAAEVIHVKGQKCTVRDVIQFLSVAEGGVHYRDNLNERERALRDYNREFFVGSNPVVVATLRGMSRVLARGTAPLAQGVLLYRLAHGRRPSQDEVGVLRAMMTTRPALPQSHDESIAAFCDLLDAHVSESQIGPRRLPPWASLLSFVVEWLTAASSTPKSETSREPKPRHVAEPGCNGINPSHHT